MKTVPIFCKYLVFVLKKNVILIGVFQLEDVEVAVADHVQRVMKPNFGASWEEIGPENELEDTFALSTVKSLEGKIFKLGF